jgi:hypothetical protein
MVTASRAALALTIGRPLRPDEFACHSCDNPPCVNPFHLFAGSPRDNVLDSMHKGRARKARGSDNPKSKFTADQVLAIRAHEDRRGLNYALAREYGVAANSIRRIRLGLSWQHLRGTDMSGWEAEE